MAIQGGADQAVTAQPRKLVAVLVAIGMVTAVISSLGAPLLPTIARADHVSLGNAQWSLTVTMLVGAVVSPVLGRLGDGPGRRSFILGSLALVVLGSALAALPFGGFAFLLIGRALHGFGLGLMPLTMAVARDHLPEHRSGPTIALLSIAGVAGVGLGYPLTGVLDEALGLHDTFWFGAVVAGAALVAGALVLPSTRHVARRPLDATGAVLLGLGLIGLLLAVTEGQSWGWASPTVVVLLAGSVMIGAGWVRRELTTPHPLVDLRLLRHSAVAGANLSAFLIAAAMYMFLPLLTDYAQIPRSSGYGFGSSVVVAGLMLVPFSVLSTSMSRVARVVAARFGSHVVIPVGSLVMASGVALFAATGRAAWEGFVSMGIAGIGVGFTFAAMPGLIVGAVPLNETGSALGFYQVVRYVGFSFGSALAAALLVAYTPAGSARPERHGFAMAMAVSAVTCVVAAAVSAAVRSRRSPEPAPPERRGMAARATAP